MIDITPFAQSVYDVVQTIPKGKITTYKLIGIALGKPNACQAIGSVLAKNPFAPIVPCHRVLTSDYKMGGYFGSTDLNSTNVKKKIKLLKSEGIKFDDNKIINSDVYKKSIIYEPKHI